MATELITEVHLSKKVYSDSATHGELVPEFGKFSKTQANFSKSMYYEPLIAFVSNVSAFGTDLTI